MPFELAKVDEDALNEVDIRISGTGLTVPDSGESAQGIALNSNNLQFPPKITKDSKSAEWKEVTVGSFEPLKFYVQSKSRAIGIDFEWVCGGRFTPTKVHQIISAMKSYFYGPYFASGKTKQDYPTVVINKFYGIIPSRLGGTTWRMMDLSIKYSKEMCKVDGTFYPLHVVVSINLESATQLGKTSSALNSAASESEEDRPGSGFSNLNQTVTFSWF